MATIAIMVGGAILNAATFIGGNYLAKALSFFFFFFYFFFYLLNNN